MKGDNNSLMYTRGVETGLSRRRRGGKKRRFRSWNEEEETGVYTKYNQRRKCFNLLHSPFRSAAQHSTPFLYFFCFFRCVFGSGARRERNTDIFRPTGFVIPDKLECPGKIGRSRIKEGGKKKKYKANHCNSSHYDDCFLLFFLLGIFPCIAFRHCFPASSRDLCFIPPRLLRIFHIGLLNTNSNQFRLVNFLDMMDAAEMDKNPSKNRERKEKIK